YIYSFLVFFVPAVLTSYGAMIVLGLPGLYLFSKVAPLTLWRTCVLGAVLGALYYVPWMVLLLVLMLSHELSFAEIFASVPLWGSVGFAVGGLVTAAAYWFLGGRRVPP